MNLNAVADYRVLVVGDAIIDRYCFCEPMGRSTKDMIISARFGHTEDYRGGVWACAEHIKELCKTVDAWHGERGVINTKFIGRYSQKLFSLHEESSITSKTPQFDAASYDVVIAFDYGHGFLTKSLRNYIRDNARFLAVNAQTNSSNFGFNRVNEKWPEANLCVIDEMEARLAAHDAESPIEEVIKRLPYPKIIVTMGAAGAIGYDAHGFVYEKAHTDRPVDLLGAGDAVLSIVAPFAAAGFSMQELIHLGSVAGAIKVGIMGHQAHITKTELEKHL